MFYDRVPLQAVATQTSLISSIGGVLIEAVPSTRPRKTIIAVVITIIALAAATLGTCLAFGLT